jgi:hypothetical protein
MDSRATSAISTVQLQQQHQQQQAAAAAQQQASGQRRLFEVVEAPADRHDDAPDDYYISDLYNQLTQVIVMKPTEIEPLKIGI